MKEFENIAFTINCHLWNQYWKTSQYFNFKRANVDFNKLFLEYNPVYVKDIIKEHTYEFIFTGE